jgi:2-dehydropantoate 2-reductase
VRILVLGAGVIGSVYAGQLLEAGHHVALVARGTRLTDLRTHGLVLEDAGSGEHRKLPIEALDVPAPVGRYDLVIVAVRCEQLTETLPILAEMTGAPDVLFLGHTAGHRRVLIEGLGDRALLGFPAAGGARDGATVRYVLIRQQKTMLGEPTGALSSRVQRLRSTFSDAGFPTRLSADIDGWLLGHVAFVVPIAFALYRTDTDPARLARDPVSLCLMVRATAQAFRALRTAHAAEIPTNLTILYLRMPEQFAVRYWQRVFASPRGELWFAGHTRGAVHEMAVLRDELLAALHRIGQPTPDLDTLTVSSDDRDATRRGG